MKIDPELISLLDRTALQLEFIDTKGEAADIPDIDGLDIHYQGEQKHYSFVNGRSSTRIIHTYVITPSKVGDYIIGPVLVKFQGGEKQLSAKLRVIKPEDDTEAQQLSQSLFSEISTPDDAPFVHEPFDLELNVYVRDGVQIDEQFSIRGGLPESGLDGELLWKATGRSREERDGVIFTVYRFQTTAKALTPGELSFTPQVQLSLVVPRERRRSWGFGDPFRGDFFGLQETRPFVLECNRLTVDVQPIPTEGRPPSFTGSVGVLDFDVTVSPNEIKAGDPVTLKMRISGSGNLKKINPPSVGESSGIKRYDPRAVPTEQPNEVLFEQVVIPSSDSVTEIPAVSFSYFNTQTADFRTIRKGPFPVTVEPAPRQAAQIMAATPGPIQQETKVLGHDIAYLKSKPERWKTAEDLVLHRTVPFRIALVLPALLVAVTALIVGQRNRLADNVALARRQKAPKAARHNIHRAEHAIKKKDVAAFNEAMWDALAEYFGHRFNLSPGQISLEVVLAWMPDEADTIEHLFTTIEKQRYGIQSEQASQAEMKKLLKLLVETLKKCERVKR